MTEYEDDALAPGEKPRDLSVMIITPCHGAPESAMAVSVANAMSHFLTIDYDGVLKCGWEVMSGSNLCQQRQQLVSRALNQKATHILCWDSDIEAPVDTIARLLNHSKAIVCVNYPTKEMTSRPTVYVDGDDRIGPLWTKPGDTGLVGDVTVAGLGLMLIDSEVFFRADLPWFAFEAKPPDFILTRGEDHYFCDKVRSVGIPIFCDQDLSQQVAHIGRFRYTNEWANKAEETRQKIYNGETATTEPIKEAAE